MKHDETLPQKLVNMLSEKSFVIFLFHGVINQSNYSVRNYTRKHILTDLFSKCLKLLKENGKAISMDEILYFNKNNLQIPPKSFAITFDDGFENNISIASPILYDLKIPATIYVTTDFIEKNSMSWIDRIEFALENTSIKSFEIEFFKKKLLINDNRSKINFLSKVRQFLKNSSECNPFIFADTVCDLLGFPNLISSDDILDKKMSWKQVSLAHNSDLLNIGGHSHTHAILSHLDEKQLAFELDTSIELLKKKAGIKTYHYSYPEGLEHCFSKYVIESLKKRGVSCCPTAMKGINKINEDLFLLKRVMV